MGDMGDDFRAWDEHKKVVRSYVEPKRLDFAMKELKKAGFNPTYDGDSLLIWNGNGNVRFWAFTGWFCGMKPVGHIKGRGIKNLIEALKKGN